MDNLQAPPQPNLQTTPTPPQPPKKLPLSVIIVAICFALASGIIGYLIGQRDPFALIKTTPLIVDQTANETNNAGADIDRSQVPLKDENLETGWVKTTITSVGLSMNLPPQIAKLGEIEEQILKGETGTQLCIQFNKQTGLGFFQAYAGGGCSTAKNDYITMGTTSIDFSAGRSGGFTDFQGFIEKNGEYLFKFPGNKEFSWDNESKVTYFKNQNNIEMLLVDGEQDIPDDEGPSLRNGLGENSGVVINTASSIYPGFAIIFHKDGLTEEEMNKVLESLEFVE